MDNTLINLIYFITSYVIIFLLYALYIYRRKKKDFKKTLEVDYLVSKFKLRKVDYNRLKWILTIINPLIISITFLVVININSFVLGVMIGFVIMMLLIYSLYEILGRYLKRKEDKNV